MQGRHNLYFKLQVHSRINVYWRSQVVHPCFTDASALPVIISLQHSNTQKSHNWFVERRHTS